MKKTYYFKEINGSGWVRANLRALKEVTDVYTHEEAFSQRDRAQDKIWLPILLTGISVLVSFLFFQMNISIIFCIASCGLSVVGIITTIHLIRSKRKMLSDHAKRVLFPEFTDPEDGEWIPVKFTRGKMSNRYNVELDDADFSLNVLKLVNIHNEMFNGDLYLDSTPSSYPW